MGKSKVDQKDTDKCQLLIKTDVAHRKKFKAIAYSYGLDMTEYFHKIVDDLPTWPVVKPIEKQ